jgi:hypothetical protein
MRKNTTGVRDGDAQIAPFLHTVMDYLTIRGSACLALDAASSAAFRSWSERNFLK